MPVRTSSSPRDLKKVRRTNLFEVLDEHEVGVAVIGLAPVETLAVARDRQHGWRDPRRLVDDGHLRGFPGFGVPALDGLREPFAGAGAADVLRRRRPVSAEIANAVRGDVPAAPPRRLESDHRL